MRKSGTPLRLALCVLAALAVLAAVCAAGGSGTALAPIAPEGGRDFVSAEFTYDQGTRTLRGSMEMTLTNRTGDALDQIVLRAYMNGEDERAVSVSGARINGEPAALLADEDDPTVLRAAYSWPEEETVRLTMTVMIRHAKAQRVISLPVLAMYERGVWRDDAVQMLMEPGYAQPFDFVVEVDGAVAARLRMARDASFALPCGGALREKEVSGVLLRALAGDAGTARTLLAQAEAALLSLNDAGIAYPYDVLTIAQSETGRMDGLAYSGLIALDAQDGGEQLRRRLTRLIAREVFGIFVESDPWQQPWLSVSLASCCELLAYRKLKGEAAYETRFYEEIEPATRLTRPHGVCVGAPAAYFGSDSEMTQVLRDQGAWMLLGIEQAIGEEAFITALSEYVQENAGKTATAESLAAALERASGSSWEGYLEDGLRF
ncbi:MAG: hypothetical protein IJO02_11325 [Clostridia bacterium]|nr:hypothetical protein [Clostridia bacterium]